MNRGSLVRILLTMALVGDGVGLASALSEERTLNTEETLNNLSLNVIMSKVALLSSAISDQK